MQGSHLISKMRRKSLTMLDSAQSQVSSQIRRSSIIRRGSVLTISKNAAAKALQQSTRSAANNLKHASMSTTVPGMGITGAVLMRASNQIARSKVQTGIYRTLTHRLYNGTRLPVYALMQAMNLINKGFQKHPLLYGSLFAGFKGLLADYFAQRVVEQKSHEDVNWHRNYLFGLVGVLYTGFVVYAVYVKIYPKLFKFVNHWHWLKQATFKSFIDQFIHNMIIYLPFFYAFKAGVYEGFTYENCKNGVSHYVNDNLHDDMIASMSVWGPANIITFAFIPPHLKTPWLSMVSFVWIVVLSKLRGENDEKNDKNDKNDENETTTNLPPTHTSSHGTIIDSVAHGVRHNIVVADI